MAPEYGRTLGRAAVGSLACAAAFWMLKSPEQYSLQGKVVLVTGGSRGLGLLLAREFSRRGCLVAVCSRDPKELSKVEEEFAGLGRHFLARSCDVGDKDQGAALVAAVQAQLGPIDVLVNNAGTIQVGPLENQRLEDFEQTMRSNFWSAVHTTFAVLPEMKSRRTGRIVNITSIGGKIAVPHLLPYSASKFALVGFSKGLRTELAKDGILVTTVVPGLMRTGSPRNAETAGQHAKEYGWFMLSGSLPGISISAQTAAEKIVQACVAGTGEIVLGAAAQLAAMFDALAPNVMAAVMEAANQWLLPAEGDSDEHKLGFESESSLTRNFLTVLTRMAERQNNEI